MEKWKKMLTVAIGFIVVIACGFFAWHAIVSRANPTLPKTTLTVDGKTFSVELATSSVARVRGLSFRTSLGQDEGMLFIFPSSSIRGFWMKDMNFPLDMIWIGNGKVLGFAQNAQPQPGAAIWQLDVYFSPDGVNQVLEVNAGTVAKDNIKVGDSVVVSRQ